MPETVEVLLERGSGGTDRLLTYLIPPVLAARLKLGARVVVPVGHREMAGIVLSLAVPPPAGTVLRPISRLLEEAPLVSESRAVLADWLAGRYLCRRCDAWRLFLPPGVARTAGRRLRLAVPPPELERRLTRFILPSNEARRLAAGLGRLKGGDLSPDRLRQELGPLYQQVEVLLSEGYLAWREPWQRQRPGARLVATYRLAGQPPPKPTPKQAKVLAYLAERPDGSATRSELLAACAVGRAVLDRLVAAGCLTPGETVSHRVPGERETVIADRLPSLYPAQEAAVAWVRDRLGQGGSMLLHGVTGSGKTEVYLQAIALALAAGKTGLLLVPEIGLTPQTVERVVARFGDRVAVLHSRLAAGERSDEWERVKSGEAEVVVGPRSALFAPLDRLGVVVLDEEHDQSYKQEDGVRYQAREVAAELSRLAKAVLILGSATPSLESMAACERGETAYFSLPERPGGRSLPPVEMVDLRQELRARRTGILSARLREALASCLDRKGQAILLLNRRGYATFVICRECGHALRCPHCDVSLTYHQGQTTLLCHYCGYSRPMPDLCPQCKGRYIRYFGLGTERLYEEAAQLFPAAKIARMDQDSTAHRGAHLDLYRALRSGEIDILIGTQMVAKGLDLPGVTLVGVVAADASLNRPDFRAAERTFQLLTQVAGRAGRGESPGSVILQTYNPEHYSLACAANHDYRSFYEYERQARLAVGYPPFAELVRIGVAGPEEQAAWRAIQALAGRIGAALKGAGNAEILGPTAALVKRVEDRFRFHMLIKAPTLLEIGPLLAAEVDRFRVDCHKNGMVAVLDVNPNTVL